MIVPGMSGLPSGLFPSYFATLILHSFLIQHVFVTCPVYHFFNLIALILFGKEYKL